jgi:hypothetical protein
MIIIGCSICGHRAEYNGKLSDIESAIKHDQWHGWNRRTGSAICSTCTEKMLKEKEIET